uniref:Uncharacterized protein n=1 Tax=Lactuca sativa TaxID=4236 RepID=A0A9R1VNW3_LACSA|nr:hypothetical protein LSAT_V11C400206260 [Lactuca sativa]
MLTDLKGKVSDLSANVSRLECENKSLVSGKMILEDVRSVLEGQVESLTQANEGLMIQNESLEWDLADREWELEVLRGDRKVLLQVGFVRIMDRLLEHPEFIGGISQIRHAAFVAREESVDAGMYDPSASDSRSSHSSASEDALLAFATLDFAGLLELGHLGMNEVRALCSFDEDEEATGVLGVGAGGVADGGASGGSQSLLDCSKGPSVEPSDQPGHKISFTSSLLFRVLRAAWRMLERSRSSSKISKFSLSPSLVSCSWQHSVRIDPIIIYVGNIVSPPYAKKNGVSFVLVHGVVRYDQMTSGNSSTQFPFAVPKRFFIP